MCINSSVATKKGNREGITELAQSDKLFCTDGRLEVENINKQKVKRRKTQGKNSFLKLSTKNLQLFKKSLPTLNDIFKK